MIYIPDASWTLWALWVSVALFVELSLAFWKIEEVRWFHNDWRLVCLRCHSHLSPLPSTGHLQLDCTQGLQPGPWRAVTPANRRWDKSAWPIGDTSHQRLHTNSESLNSTQWIPEMENREPMHEPRQTISIVFRILEPGHPGHVPGIWPHKTHLCEALWYRDIL